MDATYQQHLCDCMMRNGKNN